MKAQGRNVAERVTKLMTRPEFRTEPPITHVFDFEDLHEAMDAFENRGDGAIEVIVTM